MATKFSQYRTPGPALIEQRAEPRHRVLVSRAAMAAPGAEPVEALLQDLSVYGCRIVCAEEHVAGERLTLHFHGTDPIDANVVWSEGGQHGCRFDKPIARGLMRSLTLVIC